MLSVAPGSACDVCLDPFGSGDKAPCSIQCGHVFCEACLNNINRASCPLCRTQFEQRTIVKLHVDLDSSSSDTSLSPFLSAKQEARRLQAAIASVANEGTTEPRLRQLIAECTAFLATQPCDMFSELRISHRMIAYLCDIKAKLRSQKLELERLGVETSQLKGEKRELQQQIDILNTLRKDEKETALAVETSLREHCARAHATYVQLADRVSDDPPHLVADELIRLEQHASLMKQWTALAAKIRSPDLNETHALNAHLDIQALDMHFLTTDVVSPLSHDEAGNSNSDALLISPLPQFTTILPGTFSDLCPLLDVAGNQETRVQPLNYTSPEQPNSAAVSSSEVPLSAMPSRSRSASFIERHPGSGAGRNAYTSLSATSTPASPDNLIYRIPRSDSRSRQSSRASSRPPSLLASRPSSPRRSVSSLQAHSRIPSPLDQGLSTTAVPAAPVISRLHELMETPPISSSLPNMSNHFPSSVTREPYRSRGIQGSRSPSRSRSASIHVPPQPGPVSSASTAAMVLEKAQREQRARQRAEKEQEKQLEREKLEQERQNSQRDRPRADVERPRGHQTATATIHSHHREPIKVYSNIPVQPDYSSHRSHSGRLGSSVPRDPYLAFSSTHATKPIPVMQTARV